MEVEEAVPKRRRFAWIRVVLAVAIFGAGVWAVQEPPSPYDFLNKYRVAEKRTSKDGKLKILVLQASADEVWKAIRSHFSGKPVFTSTGYMNINGVGTQYMSLGTEDSLIKVSDDLSFANDGFGTTMQMQDVKPGYCAVAFTRPPTVFDRALHWIRSLMGGGKQKPQEQPVPTMPSSGPTIRV